METEDYYFDYSQLCTTCFIVSIVLWYIYLTWNFDYWRKQGVPGESPHIIIGTLKPTWIHSLEEQDVEAMKKFGHVHGGFIARKPVLMVSDPELVKQILVKDFYAFQNRGFFGSLENDDLMGNMLLIMKDEKWKMVRNTLSPTFTSGKLKQMIPLMEECVQNLVQYLKFQAENAEPIEFTKSFPIVTLDIIATCAFGIKIKCADKSKSEFIRHANQNVSSQPKLFYVMTLFPSLINWFTMLFPKPMEYFSKLSEQAIDMRLKNKDFSRRDFLQIMLEAEISENGSDSNTERESTGQKKTLTREIIIAQTIMFLLAGFESSSTTMSFMVYELAQNQDVQEKLIKEVDDVMSKSKGKLTYDILASMQYMDMVLSETLRMYPPGVRLDRECNEDEYNLNGIILKRGMALQVPVYAMHHNSEFFPNPNVFDPERFLPENKAKRNPFTYLSFGAGPRSCIAMRFALIEVKLVIVHMLYNYRFQTCTETVYPLKRNKETNLLQPKSVQLLLQKRLDKPEFD